MYEVQAWLPDAGPHITLHADDVLLANSDTFGGVEKFLLEDSRSIVIVSPNRCPVIQVTEVDA